MIDVCIAAHENEDFRNLFTFLEAGGRHVLGYRGSELVSHAVVTTRWAQPAGRPALRTAYVDAVATQPAYQRQGHGSAVMRRLAGAIDDYEVGCLQTDRPTFYEHLGWEVWRGPLAGRGEEGLVPTPDQQGCHGAAAAVDAAARPGALLTIECQPSRIWE